MSDLTRQDEERILFYIFLECMCRQVDMLQVGEQQNAKAWLKSLTTAATRTLKEMRVPMDDTTVNLFEEYYDYIYMTARDAAQVDASDVDEFRDLVCNFVAQKKAQGAKSIYTVNENQTIS